MSLEVLKHRSGTPLNVIADYFGISPSTVRILRIQFGISKRKRVIKVDENEYKKLFFADVIYPEMK
jgi:hypothetical protein